MANTYLSRTMGSATSRFTFTLSMWVKRSALGEAVFWNSYNSNNQRFQLYFDTNDKLAVLNSDGGVDNVNLITSRVFRDTNAWYHLYVAVKSSESTAADRVKIYVNGVRETAFATGTYQSTSNDMALGTSSYTLNIGRYGGNTAFFSGLMSHSYYVDGSIIAVTEFGSTDSTTGEWKINTSPTISNYGNQGHLILKDGNLATDQSANSNNFSIGVGSGGGLSKTEDCPSNVFATFNPLSTLSTLNYAYGNTQITGVNSNVWKTVFSTLGMNYGTTGKYYYEIKVQTLNSQAGIGVWGEPLPQTVTSNFFPNHHPFGFVYKEDGSVSDDSQTFYTGSSFTSGDIIQCALDIDNSKIYFGKNGVWQNSGDPTSGSTGTGAVPLEDNGGNAYFFFGTCYGTDVEQANFGNGYFANNPVSSAGTNASGNGIFEYDVPTGYTALSTKGLNL